MLWVTIVARAEEISLISLSEKSPFTVSRRLTSPLTRGWKDRIIRYV